ncbi:site-specific DNA-methyltransferase [Bacteroides sp. KFT8]|mgnify:FL=1|jgi:adenine-specific DNA-methyltransferase|uniref:site-specific DNA-methyltransferase n=1 Tax=Bacteroides sp. KFT8 TaxID=2025659 RepID=UPI000C053816|nr:site-specific DNA-methyltransferase [Bacteroides sp. KFT8]
MDKLRMQTLDGVQDNIDKIAALFPNCITERKDAEGKVTLAIDFDKLRQELSSEIVEGREERYQFTWPDKKKAILLANSPINATLRPCREESVDFDNTQNLYIEGDNLDVLKCLKETYLGKVKMIYIDPPYNTGNDFVYEDDFAESTSEYLANSGQYDEQGNRLVTNSESNGRFHTDWLNMMYPRLKVARDLLTDDGVIFISIDDNEVENLQKVCDEIFGENCFVATFPWRKRTSKSDVPFGISQDYEWGLCYAKSVSFKAGIEGKERKYFETEDFPNRPWRIHDLTKQTTASERPNSYFTIVNPKNGESYPANPNRTWAITEDTFNLYYNVDRIVFPDDYDFLKITKPVLRYWKEDDIKKAGDDFGKVAVSTKFPDDIGMSQDGTKDVTSIFDGKIFSFPKPVSLIKFYLDIINEKDCIVLDFFSGSATTAHAVLNRNIQDGGNRRFIMVQIPESTDEKSEAFKAGYKNICEIGKERIRRAAKKIQKDNPTAKFDSGFRVLKLDSSNMLDVYYAPSEYRQEILFAKTENVKSGRTSEDLLFQVMLELGATLDSKIEQIEIEGKTIYNVATNYLVACFDNEIDDSVVTAIAKMQPQYAVFRDSSMADDSTATNFEQIFKTYSPNTVTKVL